MSHNHKYIKVSYDIYFTYTGYEFITIYLFTGIPKTGDLPRVFPYLKHTHVRIWAPKTNSFLAHHLIWVSFNYLPLCVCCYAKLKSTSSFKYKTWGSLMMKATLTAIVMARKPVAFKQPWPRENFDSITLQCWSASFTNTSLVISLFPLANAFSFCRATITNQVSKVKSLC